MDYELPPNSDNHALKPDPEEEFSDLEEGLSDPDEELIDQEEELRGDSEPPIVVPTPLPALTPVVPLPLVFPELRVLFSTKQSVVFYMVEQGESIFFSGSAGTGKSHLFREII